MSEYSEWMRTPEAAEYLGVHIETMRRWAREGAIPAAKLGNRGGFRFKREDLDRFLERRRTEGPSPG
jgi:excisionase family DNA binding protein